MEQTIALAVLKLIPRPLCSILFRYKGYSLWFSNFLEYFDHHCWFLLFRYTVVCSVFLCKTNHQVLRYYEFLPCNTQMSKKEQEIWIYKMMVHINHGKMKWHQKVYWHNSWLPNSGMQNKSPLVSWIYFSFLSFCLAFLCVFFKNSPQVQDSYSIFGSNICFMYKPQTSLWSCLKLFWVSKHKSLKSHLLVNDM